MYVSNEVAKLLQTQLSAAEMNLFCSWSLGFSMNAARAENTEDKKMFVGEILDS